MLTFYSAAYKCDCVLMSDAKNQVMREKVNKAYFYNEVARFVFLLKTCTHLFVRFA